VGRPLEERFAVRNTSWMPKLWLEVRDNSSLPNHFSSQVVTGIGRNERFTWRVNTICRERGRFQLGPIQLKTSDPFGLFPMQRDLTPTTHVVIYPLTFDIHQFALPIGMLPGGDALRRRTHYVTTNASGVRDYAPGDSFSRIHWRSTGRRGRLIVKEFELDPLADIWIIPDMSVYDHLSQSTPRNQSTTSKDVLAVMKEASFSLPESTEEYTVAIAASLAQYFIRRDRNVALMGYGQSNEIVQPDRGERQMNRILETLSVLKAEGRIPIADLLTAESQMFPRGTTVIVVTPTTRSRWGATAQHLVRRGLRVVTVFVDPKSFGGPASSVAVADLLVGNGMVSYLVNKGDDLTAVLSQPQKQAGTIVH
jgi:uncharacterized protein (DUF58 family)